MWKCRSVVRLSHLRLWNYLWQIIVRRGHADSRHRLFAKLRESSTGLAWYNLTLQARRMLGCCTISSWNSLEFSPPTSSFDSENQCVKHGAFDQKLNFVFLLQSSLCGEYWNCCTIYQYSISLHICSQMVSFDIQLHAS